MLTLKRGIIFCLSTMGVNFFYWTMFIQIELFKCILTLPMPLDMEPFWVQWLCGTWPDDWKGYDITFLELYPIVLSSILWGSRFSNHTIEFHTDNLALVSIINKCSSRKTHIMSLVRVLVQSMLHFNFVFYAIYIPWCKMS